MTPCSIRRATLADHAEIARLSGLLGYPVAAEILRPGLERLCGSARDAVFVAALEARTLGGWIRR